MDILAGPRANAGRCVDGEGREEFEGRTGATRMNIALGQWIATLDNQQIDMYAETSMEALMRAQGWIDIGEGWYYPLGAPYGDDDDLPGWLDERHLLAREAAT
jgi:hypothetical protein